MASSFPNDMFQKVFQRFSYNIDLIEKRYANKRPCGLELDVDTGKIIQVVDAKRPRLTAEEAKEKMKTTFLAPQSLLGNSSLCSPFVNDMTAPRETKRRVLKHNKRFQHQFNNGVDCSTFLYDENGNEAAAEYNENEEDREEKELFDLDDILDDEDNGEEEDEDDDDDFEEEEDEEEVLLEIEDDDDGPSDEPDQDLEDELDNQKKSEELPFEEPEEEAEKEDDTYKNMRITRALIQRLTPKAVRGKNSATKALSKSSKKISPLNESTPKALPRRMTALKEQTEFTDSTPKPLRRRNTIGTVTKITRTLSAKEVPKTPTVSKKIAKATSEKAISKKVAVTPLVEDTVKKARGRPRKSNILNETALANDTPIASTGKKNTNSTTEKATSLNTPVTESTVIKSRGRSTKSIVLNETSPTNITPAASARKNNTKTDLEKSNAKKTPVTESTVLKSRGRPRKSTVLTEAASANVTPLSSVGKKNTKTPKKKNVLLNDGDTPKEVTTKKTKKVALKKSTSVTSLIEAPEKKARGRPRKSLPAILNVTPLAATSNGKNHKKRI